MGKETKVPKSFVKEYNRKKVDIDMVNKIIITQQISEYKEKKFLKFITKRIKRFTGKGWKKDLFRYYGFVYSNNGKKCALITLVPNSIYGMKVGEVGHEAKKQMSRFFLNELKSTFKSLKIKGKKFLVK